MYTSINFKTKKALKEAVAAGQHITVFQPNDMFGNPAAKPTFSGRTCVEGPHYQMHTWYATVQIENGRVVKVL